MDGLEMAENVSGYLQIHGVLFLFQKDKVVVNTRAVDVNAFNFCCSYRDTREYCALC